MRHKDIQHRHMFEYPFTHSLKLNREALELSRGSHCYHFTISRGWFGLILLIGFRVLPRLTKAAFFAILESNPSGYHFSCHASVTPPNQVWFVICFFCLLCNFEKSLQSVVLIEIVEGYYYKYPSTEAPNAMQKVEVCVLQLRVRNMPEH